MRYCVLCLHVHHQTQCSFRVAICSTVRQNGTALCCLRWSFGSGEAVDRSEGRCVDYRQSEVLMAALRSMRSCGLCLHVHHQTQCSFRVAICSIVRPNGTRSCYCTWSFGSCGAVN